MKVIKKLTNKEVEALCIVLNGENSFLKTMKLPYALRQAIRINVKTLMDRLTIYSDERSDIIKRYVSNGYGKDNGNGTVSIDNHYLNAFKDEVSELEAVNNDLELEVIDKAVIDELLKNNDFTLAEEDTILAFASEEAE